MKIFVDSANLGEIEAALKRGFPAGVTTNPTILAQEEKGDFVAHMRQIVELVRRYEAEVPLSVEVFTADPCEMVAQAEQFVRELGDYEPLYVKVPIGWDELVAIRELRRRGIKVNCTCCMSFNQAIMAANAGAHFVSLFYNRIKDAGADAAAVVRQVSQTFKSRGVEAELIVGSIRHVEDVEDAIQAGADVVTVPPKFFRQMVSHPKTDEAVRQFVDDFARWQS
jgi:transaldolase